MDGRWHRSPVIGDKGHEKSGTYKGWLDGRPSGLAQNWKQAADQELKWVADVTRELTPAERARMAQQAERAMQERAAEQAAERKAGAIRAQAIWKDAAPAETHPYLGAKEVPSHGLRVGVKGQAIKLRKESGSEYEASLEGALIIPARDAGGTLTSLQFIRPDGRKTFLPGGAISGAFHMIGEPKGSQPVAVAEGYATGCAVHELTGMPVAVAFFAGNLKPVAEVLRAQNAHRTLYIAGDNDHNLPAKGKANVGKEKALAAAEAVGGIALIPEFAEGDHRTDWHDMTMWPGKKEAHRQMVAAMSDAHRQRGEKIRQELKIDREPARAPSQERSAEVARPGLFRSLASRFFRRDRGERSPQEGIER